MARRSAPARRRPVVDDADVPVVGGREPCPCGSGKRYKACHGLKARVAATAAPARPFEGLAGEADWVALREVVPAATAPLVLAGEVAERAGDADVRLATVLPLAWPALKRADGSVLVGLQVTSSSADASRDLAAALLAALDAQPGTPVVLQGLPGPGPRLQDVLDPATPLDVTVHEGFEFWIEGAQEITPEVRASMERANGAVVPTERLEGVPGAYWCRIGDREHLRWVRTEDEEALLDALARLHARGASGLGEDTRYVGSFRAHGRLVPVWDLPFGMGAAALAAPVAAFEAALAEALADCAPLTSEERRARAGVVSRQVTLR